jgi:hypothetical protein
MWPGGPIANSKSATRISDQIQSILRAAGLKVATQKYEYTSSGITHEGQSVYAIIHAPRGDATEAIVLVAAWKTADGELNLNGVSLALTLARYFKRGSNLIAMHCGEEVVRAVLMTIVSRLVFVVQRYHFSVPTRQQIGNAGVDRCVS